MTSAPRLHYQTIPVTPFQQNCSIVWCEQTKEAAVIDPGGDLPRIPAGKVVVTESGILGPNDVAVMRHSDVNAFLVGEAFMRQPSPGSALETLFAA